MKKIITLLLVLVLMSEMTVQTFAMQIFVKDYVGKTITLEVAPTDTIAVIKAKILEKTGIAPKQQKLFFGDTELADNDKTLNNHGINRESTLKLDIHFFDSPMNGDSGGAYFIGVNGTYTPSGAAGEIVSTDITWDAMSFTYTAGSVGTWNPETHTYTGGTQGSWSANKVGITVTNHSNVGVDVGFTFTPAAGASTIGTFYTRDGDTYTAITSHDDQKLSLRTAVGTEWGNAPVGTFYFGVSGEAINESKTLGTITVKIAKEKWTEVTTEVD